MPEILTHSRIGTGLRSMTGYAAAVAEPDGFTLTVSLRSVNHRYLDLHLHLPEPLWPLESKARREIQERNPRGHLELKVTLEREAEAAPAVDEALVGRYVELFRRLGAQYGLPALADIATLSQLPGVVSAAGPDRTRELWQLLEAPFLKALRETLDRWDQMRAEEARHLAEDLGDRILRVRGAVERMEQLRQEIVPRAQQRLQERVQALLGQAGLDAARLAQEAALLADRSDTSEEILRLKAHGAQFSALLAADASEGRRLDFLLQEMNRELNTLLAKTAGLGESGLPGTQLGLEMKAEVEKLREQVQNLQ